MLSLLDYSNITLDAPASKSINGYELFPTYPNPTSDTAQISFQLPKESKIEIKLYSITGAEMALIAKETLAEGKHEISYNFSSLPKGLYYYTLQANEYQLSQKVKVD
ncbi:T9SS type A sorting domain-containing protein [Reichenbachiella sp. ABR2-5]|uniref:T9SS type A sorting domain-containing protein n=2 Tax=Reichenbachiella ulvae TaxID=2980104 RepID=A0ABT3CNG5_9BACT|nr:T9SS type A sorting domain-containing protein [Reichenbachiella ulvae]